jgi:DNA-binding NarL/FixJ family response regulator
MRIAPPVVLSAEQRRALERMARQRTLAKRLVERAQIVLRAADGLDDTCIAEQLRTTRKTVARWRRRFLKGGTAALHKDAPRGAEPAPSVRNG